MPPSTSNVAIGASVHPTSREWHQQMRLSTLSSPIGGAPRETAGGAGYRRTSAGVRSASPAQPRVGGRGRPPRQLAGGPPVSGRGDRAGPPVGLSGNGFGPIRLPRWVVPFPSTPSASPPLPAQPSRWASPWSICRHVRRIRLKPYFPFSFSSQLQKSINNSN